MLTDMTLYVDRSDAGRQLAGQLEYLRGQDVLVLGLPRGGVPVAFEVSLAARLTIPKRARLLDVGTWVVRQPDTAALR